MSTASCSRTQWAALLTAVVMAGCDGLTDPMQSVRIDPVVSRIGIAESQVACVLLSSGIPRCWGAWWDPPNTFHTPGNGDLRFITLNASASHFCALTSAGEAWCWGTNYYGELGDGTTRYRSHIPGATTHGYLEATRVLTDRRFVAIAPALLSTCALEGNGRAWCWGQNSSGMLGTGTDDSDQPLPVPVATDARFKFLDGGGAFCGITMTDETLCWGQRGGSVDPWILVLPGDCDTTFYSWYLGRKCLTPTPLAGGLKFRTVAGGRCGLTISDEAYCWDDGIYGQFGNGSAGFGNYSVTPVPASGRLRFRQVVTSGTWHVCALTLEGEAWCWGLNSGGQLGNGRDGGGWAQLVEPTPQRVLTTERFVEIDSHGASCGLTASEEVWCWGYPYGNTPVKVPVPQTRGEDGALQQ